jgi:hypothetical protein
MIEFQPIWILAQSDPYRTTGSSLPTPEAGTKEIQWFDDMAIVAGVGLVLMVVLAIWAKFLRPVSGKDSRRKDEFRSVPDASSLSNNLSNSERRRKKRRRRRRDHRPRNPTLSETGGLPQRKDSTPKSP